MLNAKCKIVNTIDKNKWSNFVLAHPHGNIFQTPEMFEISYASIRIGTSGRDNPSLIV